jgi:hypothetical protein
MQYQYVELRICSPPFLYPCLNRPKMTAGEFYSLAVGEVAALLCDAMGEAGRTLRSVLIQVRQQSGTRALLLTKA